jgi:hypothetical protein
MLFAVSACLDAGCRAGGAKAWQHAFSAFDLNAARATQAAYAIAWACAGR